jgi:hypothetical protein
VRYGTDGVVCIVARSTRGGRQRSGNPAKAVPAKAVPAKAVPARPSDGSVPFEQSWPIGLLLALLGGIALTWVTPLATAVPNRWRIALFVSLLGLAIGWTLIRLGVTQKGKALGGALGLVGASALIAVATGPSEEAKLVDSYFAVCGDPLWGTRPVNCMEQSRDVLTREFDDFAPDEWHGFDAGTGAEAVNLKELSMGGPKFDGLVVSSVGQVVATQEVGGQEVVVQLRTPTRKALKLLTQDPGLMGTVEAPSTYLASDASASELRGGPAQSLVYLNVAVRPFFSLERDELVIFNGLPIATGSVLQPATGREIPLTYVRGSSVEHLCPSTACGESQVDAPVEG